MLEVILYVLILLTAIPVGWALAWLTKDELVVGRKRFFRIIYILLVILVVLILIWREVPVLLSLVYLIIITSISLWKSGDKKFVK